MKCHDLVKASEAMVEASGAIPRLSNARIQFPPATELSCWLSSLYRSQMCGALGRSPATRLNMAGWPPPCLSVACASSRDHRLLAGFAVIQLERYPRAPRPCELRFGIGPDNSCYSAIG